MKDDWNHFLILLNLAEACCSISISSSIISLSRCLSFTRDGGLLWQHIISTCFAIQSSLSVFWLKHCVIICLTSFLWCLWFCYAFDLWWWLFSHPVCVALGLWTGLWASSSASPGFEFVYIIFSDVSIQPSQSLMPSSLSLPSILPSIRDFSTMSWLFTSGDKYWSFNFSFSPSNEMFRVGFVRSELFWSLSAVWALRPSFSNYPI